MATHTVPPPDPDVPTYVRGLYDAIDQCPQFMLRDAANAYLAALRRCRATPEDVG